MPLNFYLTLLLCAMLSTSSSSPPAVPFSYLSYLSSSNRKTFHPTEQYKHTCTRNGIRSFIHCSESQPKWISFEHSKFVNNITRACGLGGRAMMESYVLLGKECVPGCMALTFIMQCRREMKFICDVLTACDDVAAHMNATHGLSSIGVMSVEDIQKAIGVAATALRERPGYYPPFGDPYTVLFGLQPPRLIPDIDELVLQYAFIGCRDDMHKFYIQTKVVDNGETAIILLEYVQPRKMTCQNPSVLYGGETFSVPESIQLARSVVLQCPPGSEYEMWLLHRRV
eukprot:PhF_6_TR7300/c0_g1_i2/m.10919